MPFEAKESSPVVPHRWAFYFFYKQGSGIIDAAFIVILLPSLN